MRVFSLKISLLLFITALLYLINGSIVFAGIQPLLECDPADPARRDCDKDKYGEPYSCQPAPNPPPAYFCQPDVFGKIQAPDAIKRFLGSDQTGALGISKFLSNVIVLIYSIASIALIFMILWAAFEWLTSGGDKEKVAAARARLTYAIAGMILFAIAFAVIQVLGTFTGFRFFKGQGIIRVTNQPGVKFICPDGYKVGGGSDDPEVACQGHF